MTSDSEAFATNMPASKAVIEEGAMVAVAAQDDTQNPVGEPENLEEPPMPSSESPAIGTGEISEASNNENNNYQEGNVEEKEEPTATNNNTMVDEAVVSATVATDITGDDLKSDEEPKVTSDTQESNDLETVPLPPTGRAGEDANENTAEVYKELETKLSSEDPTVTNNTVPSSPDATIDSLKQESVTEEYDDINGTEEQHKTRPPNCPGWTKWTDHFIHHQIPRAVTALSLLAIRKPRWTVCIMAFMSLFLVVLGMATNFQVVVEEFEVFAPFGVPSREHREWIQDTSGFPSPDVILATLVHKDGEDIVTIDGIQRVFDAHEAVVNDAEGYHEFCAQSTYVYNGTNTCRIISVVRFWNYSRAIFEATVTTDEQLNAIVQQENYPDGTPVDIETILGNHKIIVNPDGTKTMTAQSLVSAFLLPNTELEEVRAFETVALEALFPVQDEINDNPEKYNKYSLEVQSERSYPDEFLRAIVKDFPLLPFLYIIMVSFTMGIYFRRHPVQSRALLGVAAAVTVCCSIMSGFGLMFIFGVPFTNLTMLVPFVIFGVGLDDTFIITGGFARTNPEDDIEERIRQTLKDVGLSISVTTITTTVAFGLGSVSNIPAIRWLCLYSMTTIVVDFIYQITFFIAILVLDAKRIQQNRKDVCVWITVDESDDQKNAPSAFDDESPKALQEVQAHSPAPKHQPSFVDRFMVCASLLRQEFQVTELVPSDSYVVSFLDAFSSYRSRSLPVYAYFRFVDQSDPGMQEQMVQFIEDLGELDQMADPPFCWIRDVLSYTENETIGERLGLDLQALTFNQQMDLLLSNPTIEELYGQDIVRDANGNITASRCRMYTENLNLDVVQDQIDFLHAQVNVTTSQPVNQGRENWAFFSYDDFYLTWEFYDSIVQEWIITTIVGIIAVTVVGFFCIPDWTASFFVLPMIAILYVDLVGVIQFSGLYINIVTYVALAMSIGLLVDYIVHILLRYYESKGATREEKVKDTLRTMGSAVLSGGLSTLLGVVPLAFSSSQVMRTVFVTFFAMVAIGCSHGLIFLPIVLSYLGPEATVVPSEPRSLPEPVPTPTTNVDKDTAPQQNAEQPMQLQQVNSYEGAISV
ncbi:Pick C1-like protein 1 [Seminavis robusta]|uniref:Pick C1-like protein 1 n=1 Tax=Seminavis robusta TaxID=568900 RepID=A0A9N8EFI5_9STRA|nr:Pick C1-like protein 1 [Seminavis robusta]|eukprot:Sro1019_g231980.1 Pick C1-like protein 1 (1096) ;mRNA; f:19563-23227